MKPSFFLLVLLFCAWCSPINSVAQTRNYQFVIRNHLKVDVTDLHIKLRNWKKAYYDAEIRMISNDGSLRLDNLWRRGLPFWGRAEHSSKGKNLVFNLGGTIPIKPGKRASFNIKSKYIPGWEPSHLDQSGYYWWTSGKHKKIGEKMSINRELYDEYNFNIETYKLTIPPKKKDKSAKTKAKVNCEDTVAFAMEAYLLDREELVNLGSFEGTIFPGDSAEYELVAENGEHGDSLLVDWTFENIQNDETWEIHLKSEIIKKDIMLPADTLYWSEGETNAPFITFLGGEGVEVRSSEIQDFHAEDTTEDFVSADFAFPNELKDQESFTLTFIRTGRGEPTIDGSNSDPEIDTASCVVRHGDFRPTASWTMGSGSFDPVNDSIIFPVTINREVADNDWIYFEFIGEHLSDTIWFHHEIQGSIIQVELPVDFTADELQQSDSLYLIVRTQKAPSTPDTLVADINKSQGIDHPLLVEPIHLRYYPNPFINTLTFEYALDQPNLVNLSLLDLTGREIEVLVCQNQESGTHRIVWNAEEYVPGIYYYNLRIGENQYCGSLLKINLK